MSKEVRMNVTPESLLHGVKINMLTRVVTLLGEDGEELNIDSDTSEEFINMCSFINKNLTEDMIEYTY
jgi:hypothetical protein